LVDSELAMVHAYVPPENVRQVSLNLSFETELELQDACVPLRYYIVPCVQWPDEFGKNEKEDIVWDSTPLFVDCYAEGSFTMERYSSGVFADYHAPSILDKVEDRATAIEEWFNTLPTREWEDESSSDDEVDKAPRQPSNRSSMFGGGFTGDMMARKLDCTVETSNLPMAWPVASTDPGEEGPSIPVDIWQPTQLMEMCASERDQSGVAWPVSLGWGDVGCGANDEHVLSSLNADAPWSGGDLSYAKST